MAGYIEQERGGEFFCPASQTVQVNPECPCIPQDDRSINEARWQWLVDGWNKMSFKEKMELFTPYIKVVRLFSQKSNEFDEAINKCIIETQFILCRKFNYLKYDEDHHGTPCFVLVFDPIDLDSVPDTATRGAMKMWGSTYGFYKNDSGSATVTCPVCNR